MLMSSVPAIQEFEVGREFVLKSCVNAPGGVSGVRSRLVSSTGATVPSLFREFMRRLLVTCTKRRQTEVGAPFGTCSRVWSDGAAERTGAGVAAAEMWLFVQLSPF